LKFGATENFGEGSFILAKQWPGRKKPAKHKTSSSSFHSKSRHLESTRCIVTDSTQCLAHGTGSVTVTEKAAPEVRLSQLAACEDDAPTLEVNASGTCFVTVMASGWAAPREIELTLGDTDQGQTTEKRKIRVVRAKVPLFGSGEAKPGQYTITGVRDAQCSSATSQTVTIHPKPEIMFGAAQHMCATPKIPRVRLRWKCVQMGALWVHGRQSFDTPTAMTSL